MDQILLDTLVEGHLITISAESISILNTGFRGVEVWYFYKGT